MKLLILGATGRTGLNIVNQAIARDHHVTALVRSPERLKPFRDRMTIKQGDLLNRVDLERVVKGQDAVLSGFGAKFPVSKADANLLQRFAVALTSAMLHAGVGRVVVESVAFLFRDSIVPPVYLLGRLFFSRVVSDASAMERIFQESELDWTLVRPPELTNRPYTGRYRVREDHLPRFGFMIPRADVADFMIKSVENHFASRKIFGVSQ
ncbi:MAG TPA: SDR family oxidoreductase [Terriglobia bacterium]|nr:SDR family oxidoreductase [Terriglobia bacterium]